MKFSIIYEALADTTDLRMADAQVADFGGQAACGLNGCCKALYIKLSRI